MLTEGWEDTWVAADADGRLGFFHCDRNASRPTAALSLHHAGDQSRQLSRALYETWLTRSAPTLVLNGKDILWFDEPNDRFFIALSASAHASPFLQAGIGRWWDESQRILDVTNLQPRHADAIDAHLDSLDEQGARPAVLNVTEDGANVHWEALVAHFVSVRDEPSVYVVHHDRNPGGLPIGAWAQADDLPEELRSRLVGLAPTFRSGARVRLPQDIAFLPTSVVARG